MSKLKINSNTGFINLEDLPNNCIFNKVVTGCGATTVAIYNDVSYVIAVPTTELIINKTGLSRSGLTTVISHTGKQQSIFGLFGKFDYKAKKDLKDYIKSNGIKKIMCTYDKVKYLSNYIDESKFKLLVDEYHILLKAYSYREEAVNGVIENFKKYKSFCFMSATPISPEFTPSILKDVELIEAEWNDTDLLTVKLDQTNKPYAIAANYINAYKKDGYITINGQKSYEAFFFINSVTDIISILKYCELSPDEVKIVCANTESNKKKLEGYSINSSRDPNKMFTFITSKSFEGADYFSETGMCFVVSNSRNNNTLLDISTDIYQIAGRIRTSNNPFRNLLVHIFNSSGKRHLNIDKNYEEMVKETELEIQGANAIIDLMNTNESIKAAGKRIINSEYIAEDESGKFFLNDMLVKLDLFTYKVEKLIYDTGIALRKEYNNNNVKTYNTKYQKIDESLESYTKKLSFKVAFDRYSEIIESNSNSQEIEEILRIQPLVDKAYNLLGTSKVKSLKYVKKNIELAILELENKENNEYKLIDYLKSKIKLGFMSSKTIKTILSDAYKLYNIRETPKASDISKWYKCKEECKRINNITTKGFTIYGSNIII